MRIFLATVFLTAVLSTQIYGAGSEVVSVKTYLLNTLKKVKAESEALEKNSLEYAAIIKSYGNDYQAAYKADAGKLTDLVKKMRENYKGMDSFGYETIEGIVAGVDLLSDYDVYLDAGVPKSEGPDGVALVVLEIGNGKKIDREGSLFTYIIEPTLWGGDMRWVVAVTPVEKDGLNFIPDAEVLTAAAADANKKIGNLQADATAWNVTAKDCFGAMIVMTPTFSEYFEDWKESRYSKDKSGRFQAVSRISDMRGIMKSCDVMYRAVSASVAEKDKALAKSVTKGFDDIFSFLDIIEKREKEGKIESAEIDELAERAKEKTDKLVPQIEQSASVVGIKAG